MDLTASGVRDNKLDCFYYGLTTGEKTSSTPLSRHPPFAMSLFDHSAAYLEQFDPLAPTANQLTGHNYRITVLSQALLRFEYSEDGQFEDRPSTFAVNRKFPEAEFEVQETASKLEIRTKLVYVQYYKGPFTPSSLHVSFREDSRTSPLLRLPSLTRQLASGHPNGDSAATASTTLVARFARSMKSTANQVSLSTMEFFPR